MMMAKLYALVLGDEAPQGIALLDVEEYESLWQLYVGSFQCAEFTTVFYT